MREDTRSLPALVQEEKRKQTKRYTHKEIAEQVGVHYLTVGRWIRAYQTDGIKALKACELQGRPVGSGRLLSADQQERIQRLLIDKTPDQFKRCDALWTREAVQQLMAQETGVKVAICTVGEHLKRWGFTVQKPKKQTYEQRSAEVREWLDQQYPAIHARAKDENAMGRQDGSAQR